MGSRIGARRVITFGAPHMRKFSLLVPIEQKPSAPADLFQYPATEVYFA